MRRPALALEPDAAGREARNELDVLLDKQSKDAANAKPEHDPEQTSSAKAGRTPTKAIENKIPSICKGC